MSRLPPNPASPGPRGDPPRRTATPPDLPPPDDLPDPEQGGAEAEAAEEPETASEPQLPRLQQPARGRRLAPKAEAPPSPLTAEQRVLLLDTWRRSGLPAGDFAPLVGLSKETCSQYPSCHSLGR